MTEPHSKQFLTDERDSWWRGGQLRDIAAHLALDGVRDAVDVGAGQGHWTRTIAALLPAGATLTGVEREPEWVRIAHARTPSIAFVVGTAEELPFDDSSVDLVTAQTLLIHVRDPRAVLREMARVLRPGGRLWLVEPNNIASCGAAFADPSSDPRALVATYELEIVCERGKHALGLGYNSLGERLIGLFDPATWRDIDIRLCDRVQATVPPYSAALLDRARAETNVVTWPREETLRYWLAGGGDAGAFDALWSSALELQRARMRSILDGTYAAAGGVILYSYTAVKT